MTRKTKSKYNHYTEDFQREVMRRSEDPNTSAAEVAKGLGIHPGRIYNWPRRTSACVTNSAIVFKG